MTLSRAAVYLRCALPRLRTAMRLLVWVDDETKGAASELRTTACTLLSGRLGRYRSLKLYVHFTRMWPFTCHMCVCLPLQTECMQCCLAKSHVVMNGSEALHEIYNFPNSKSEKLGCQVKGFQSLKSPMIVNSVTSKLKTEGFMTFINVSYLSDAKRINKARDNSKNSCLDHVI